MPGEDDIYNGYTIRKDTTVVVNIWYAVRLIYHEVFRYISVPARAMLHDANAYPDPFSFEPDRWTNPKIESSAHDPLNVAFGFGRR